MQWLLQQKEMGVHEPQSLVPPHPSGAGPQVYPARWHGSLNGVQHVFVPVHFCPVGQSLSARHRTHEPSLLQCGVEVLRALHWASLPQGEHTPAAEQMGAVATVQLVLLRQPTQAPVVVRQ
jgi:hypothetical protein